MKTPLFLFFFPLFCITAAGQMTNVKPGNWSDNSIWSGNTIPGSNDEVLLNFDVVVDIDAACLLLNSNGHHVTINAGVNLIITGNAADTLLARYVELYDSGGPVPDTSSINDFIYDSLKRNTSIDSKYFLDGILDREYYTTFFYEGSSTLPFKKIRTTLLATSPSYYADGTSYYSYSNGQLVIDSTVASETNPGSAAHYIYWPGGEITQTVYDYSSVPPAVYVDTVTMEYLNGNITHQGAEHYPGVNDYFYEYDDHPNPFFHTQNKIVFSYTYPFYSLGTAVEDVFAKNNATSIYESDYEVYSSTQVYEYKANGYPKKVVISSPDGDSYGLYFYTH